MEKLLEALPKCYQIGKQLEHLATSSTNTSLGDTMGNYKKKKKVLPFWAEEDSKRHMYMQ